MALDESRFPKDILAEADDDASDEEENDVEQADDAASQDAGKDEEQPNEFDGLDLRYVTCFGYSYPKAKSWTNLAEVSIDKGWENIDAKSLEEDLMHNVEACYYKIVQLKLQNINDDMAYVAVFDNNRGLWDVFIENSPKAELTIEQRSEFFKSEIFKRSAKRAYYIILDAKKTYENVVKWHIEHGELIDIDVVKLDAILHWIDKQYFLDNILNGKYLSY